MTPRQIMRLALEAGVSDNTVRRYLKDPTRAEETTRERITRGAAALSIKLPVVPDREPHPTEEKMR